MSVTGKTIRIYLVDGVPNGILTAEIINWTGKFIVAPRARLGDLAKRDEATRTGVYFLSGADPENATRDRVYIGEADNVLKRLVSHDQDESKDFWTRAALVISKDENLTKAHGRYLESRLIDMAMRAGRASLANGTAPSCPVMPEPDVADMEFFLEQAQMILPILGFNVLQPKPEIREVPHGEVASPLFVLAEVGVDAKAREIDGEFVVLKDSSARKQGVPSWTSYKSLREQLLHDAKIAEGDAPDFLVFTEDVAFSSPSAAAAVVLGRNTNGRRVWKTADTGETYQQWYEKKLAVVSQTLRQTDDSDLGKQDE